MIHDTDDGIARWESPSEAYGRRPKCLRAPVPPAPWALITSNSSRDRPEPITTHVATMGVAEWCETPDALMSTAFKLN